MAVKTKIALFLPSLENGGAERVMVNIANGLAEVPSLSVDIVLVNKKGPYVEQVSSKIRLIDLGCNRILACMPSLIRYMREEEPSAVCSASDPANLVLIWCSKLARSKSRIVVTEHCNIENALASVDNRRSALLPTLIRWFYPLSHQIVAVSQGVAESLQSYGIDKNRISVIVNPVITEDLTRKRMSSSGHPWFKDGEPPVILGVGRLAYQKNFHMLIRCLKGVNRETCARLIILGEGDDRSSLLNLAKTLGVEEQVALPGFVENPYSYMAEADVFVLSSRFEGLPTVLIEALYCGCDVISTDCPDGPREILFNGRYGKLIPLENEEHMCEQILETLNGNHPKIDATALDPYFSDTVIAEYMNVLLPGVDP